MTDLRTVLVPGSLELKNPVLNAAGTMGYGVEYEAYGDITSLGAVVTNGITLAPCAGAPMPRIVETPSGLLSAVGLQNCGARHFADEILPRMPWNLVPVIPNVNATNVDDFAAIAGILSEERGVAAIEVNLDCPNDHRGGQPFCQNPVTAARAVNAVRRHAGGKPVIAKLSPLAMDIVEVARAVEAAGADIISCIGPLRGMSVDVRSRRSRLGSPSGRLSGPAIKPVALLCVREIARVVRIPIIGMGGISSAGDVLEFMLVGASAVGVGSHCLGDPAAIFQIVRELPEECARLGIGSLRSLRGALSA